MRKIGLCVCVLCCAWPAPAQTCTPTVITTGAYGFPADTFGNIPQGLNQGGTQQNFVPDGDVWVMLGASVGQIDAGTYPDVRVSLHVEYQYDAASTGIYIFAVEPMQPAPSGTPFLVVRRPIVLLPRMRLGARFNQPPPGLHVGLLAYGARYPLSCLERVLLGGSPSSPDLSTLVQAAQAAATALQAMAASVPP